MFRTYGYDRAIKSNNVLRKDLNIKTMSSMVETNGSGVSPYVYLRNLIDFGFQ